MIISIIMAAVVLIIAWYICLANDVYLAYQDWYALGEVDYTLTFFESVQVAYLFLADAPGYLVDLVISLVLAGVGCGGYVSNMVKKAKVAQNANVEAPVDGVTPEAAAEVVETANVTETPAEETSSDDTQA